LACILARSLKRHGQTCAGVCTRFVRRHQEQAARDTAPDGKAFGARAWRRAGVWEQVFYTKGLRGIILTRNERATFLAPHLDALSIPDAEAFGIGRIPLEVKEALSYVCDTQGLVAHGTFEWRMRSDILQIVFGEQIPMARCRSSMWCA
jgi:hypothetical protein